MPNNFNFIKKTAMGLVRMYQVCISPFIGGQAACRFTPTCSEYTRQAIAKYGVVRGTILGIKRISRCRPGGGCGYDPVP
ncbi:MAG: membrane protein insertion efficiency factor YidD [Alphaproteobacteria bacterium]|nr:membrane protein insertion efficiency factor YidD [Alphaproteobacteria bacterium]MBQ7949494.1 membrane protein insertion efficiency factor YidD [Alphaproteobacteria bacterium]MBR2341993.1 membrane protein insertion efficiency factor YidD [Alphaproteobacteria bacterium]MBR2482878.1 membrane protein insertion efficiency factor YidD [Alphaproteobacteria bacterium]